MGRYKVVLKTKTQPNGKVVLFYDVQDKLKDGRKVALNWHADDNLNQEAKKALFKHDLKLRYEKAHNIVHDADNVMYKKDTSESTGYLNNDDPNAPQKSYGGREEYNEGERYNPLTNKIEKAHNGIDDNTLKNIIEKDKKIVAKDTKLFNTKKEKPIRFKYSKNFRKGIKPLKGEQIKKFTSAFNITKQTGLDTISEVETEISGDNRYYDQAGYVMRVLPDLPESDLNKYMSLKNMGDVYDSIKSDPNIDPAIRKLASCFNTGNLDITSKEQMGFLALRNAETGEYESLGIDPAKRFTKDDAIDFLSKVATKVDEKKMTLYNFSQLQGGSPFIQVFSEGVAIEPKNVDVKIKLPDEPTKVSKPNFFKGILNTIFGAFQKEFDDFHKYESDYAKYTDERDKANAEIERRLKFVRKGEKLGEEYKEKLDKFKEVTRSLKEKRDVKDDLYDKVTLENKHLLTSEVISGKKNDLLSVGDNYQILHNTELIDHPELPMESLALLSTCSKKHNFNAMDGSTTFSGKMVPKEPLNPEEQKLFDDLQYHGKIGDITGKIFNSLLSGSDVRMNNRVKVVIDGRLELNNATEEYLKGNMEPLVNLLNDCWEPVYYGAKNTSERVNSPEASAIKKMIDGMDELFNKDPELRNKVSITDDQLKELRGFSRIVEIMENPANKAYSNYLKDEGPDTPERKEVVEDMLFSGIIKSKYLNSFSKNYEDTTMAIQHDPLKGLPEGFKDKFALMDLLGNVSTRNINVNLKFSDTVKLFSGEPYNPDTIKEQIMKEVRNTKAYKELLSSDKKDLFKEHSFDNAVKDIAKEATKIKEQNNPNLDLNKKNEGLENNKKNTEMHV